MDLRQRQSYDLSLADVARFETWACDSGFRYQHGDVSMLRDFPVPDTVTSDFTAACRGQPAHVVGGGYAGRQFVFFGCAAAETFAKTNLAAQRTWSACVDLPGRVPRLDVERQSWIVSVVRGVLGRRGIRHDRRVELVTEDDEFARELFAPDTVTWLVDNPIGRVLPFRFDGRSLAALGFGIVPRPEFCWDVIMFLRELVDRLPPQWRTHDT